MPSFALLILSASAELVAAEPQRGLHSPVQVLRLDYEDVTLAVEPDLSALRPAAFTAAAAPQTGSAVPASPGRPDPAGVMAPSSRPQPWRIGKWTVLSGGKLMLTNAVTTVEGVSGGGVASWATIAGREMDDGIGLSSHVTAIELPDFGWRSFGVALGLANRVELSISRADFDTRKVGAALGLGQGYTLNQETYGAKVRLLGDLVYGPSWLPQVAIGIEHKRNRDGPVVAALGAAHSSGTDFTLSATKLLLAPSILANATMRYTKANQIGLLGFGSAAGSGYRIQFEGSVGYQLSRRAMLGAELRTKADNLGLGESNWVTAFAAYALNTHFTVTAAYVDLGTVATIKGQRGAFLSTQVAF